MLTISLLFETVYLSYDRYTLTRSASRRELLAERD
jgi:hypothetical protein